MLAVLLLVPGLVAQQCKGPEDCKSDYAPHCSRWGWCQWTSQYGVSGPPQTDPGDPGCETDQDCTPRAPYCSRQGYCTERPGLKEDTEKHKGSRSHQKSSGTSGHQNTRQHNTRHQDPRHQDSRRKDSRHQDSRRKDSRHHGMINLDIRIPNRKHVDQGLPEESPRSRGVIPSGTFLLKQMDTGFGQRHGNQGEGKSQSTGRNLHIDHTPIIHLTTPPPNVEEEYPVYYQDYDYDYDYYRDFEVQKTIVDPEEYDQEGRSGNESDGEKSLGVESQGCLYDCVYDCVSIAQLTAYRDCVDFCGKTCKNK